MTPIPRRRARARPASDATELASLFAALGDKARLQIVSRLCNEGPLSITRLTEGSNISRQAITKHLNALSAAGVIEGERSGRNCVWQIHTDRLTEAQRFLDQISAHWDDAIGRLQAMVESEDH